MGVHIPTQNHYPGGQKKKGNPLSIYNSTKFPAQLPFFFIIIITHIP